jgi:hypothetical protein
MLQRISCSCLGYQLYFVSAIFSPLSFEIDCPLQKIIIIAATGCNPQK